MPFCKVQVSPNAMRAPPANAITSPSHAREEVRSSRKRGENTATNSGAVCTSTTELATEVNSSEAIQVAKCKARNTPESAANIQDRFPAGQAFLGCRTMRGTRNNVAISNLNVAIAMLLASVCAKRMKIEELEAARMPNRSAIGGEMCGFLSMINVIFSSSYGK